ncbi:hypothetical protein FisN_16Lh064 [Fistulifera solaris]|uniref:Uncharacterized protein n=1 Tax=Fistulifera solaris TaxID=1519565 RepID=A0A1Z5KJB6_FISSO|nr:hypothetical protein FisN_16Lh064 [Fistulifera solaris]|eukprot:GAX26235.1 hypothetical protein FisN_16Lh064 [Fistulifera solaris]
MLSGFSADKEEVKSTMTPGPGLDTVADLERKLALLRAAETTTNQPSSSAPAFALPAAEVKKPSGESKDGKSALLARIMAAQERAKQAQQPPAMDLLSDTPPAFDAATLPPLDQPPAFDDTLLPAPVQQQQPVFSWDPHAPTMTPPPASAPDLNDLLAFEAPLPSNEYLSNNNSSSNTESNEDVIAAILAMEGMSEADKQALIDEQIKIMASIEKSRTNDRASAAHSAADAFESRSFSNNVQSVNNPSRRMHTSTTFQNASSAEEAAQLKADMELAEALQKEEYEQAERQQRPRTRPAPAPAPPQESSQSWLEWLGVTSSSTAPTNRNDAPPPYSAPGQGTVSRGSYDEDEALLRPRARVAQSQPLFACVTDSVSTALTYAVSPPPEGVDSTSLLAMPQVGRNNEYERQE